MPLRAGDPWESTRGSTGPQLFGTRQKSAALRTVSPTEGPRSHAEPASRCGCDPAALDGRLGFHIQTAGGAAGRAARRSALLHRRWLALPARRARRAAGDASHSRAHCTEASGSCIPPVADHRLRGPNGPCKRGADRSLRRMSRERLHRRAVRMAGAIFVPLTASMAWSSPFTATTKRASCSPGSSTVRACVWTPWYRGDSRYELFRCFRLPLFDTTKREMRTQARQSGFDEIMSLTWFCHRPRRGQPCGTCNPCIYTIEERLGERVPLAGRIRHRLRIVPRLRHWWARHPGLYLKTRALYRRVRPRRTADGGVTA